MSHTETIGAQDEPRRQAFDSFYGRLAEQSLAPLWEVMKGLVPVEPKPKMAAHLWRWDMVRRHALEAAGLLTAEQAERRVLVLENPAFAGQSRATNTLYAGVQLVMPGEVAPAHRHTQSAMRFVLESARGYTAVNGERTTMEPGDFVITPSWSFHDHGNEGEQPVLWLDVLDVPVVSFFEAGFSEHHNAARQTLARPEGDALHRFGSGLLPMQAASPYGMTSPVFSYPYTRTRPALAALADNGPLDPHWGAALRFANPLDGGWAMPTVAPWMVHLPAGFQGTPARSTDGLIVAVAEGRGVASIGDKELPFGPKDVFVVPNWTWRSFKAQEDVFLFVCSDRVMHEKLGLWREERAGEPR
jgi:gentisate 1,2-dioxygenase